MDLGRTPTTIFSLAHDLPTPLPQAGAAHGGLDAGQLEHDGASHACQLCWIGPAGARLRVDGRLAEQAPALLRLEAAEPLAARTLWQEAGEAGLAFAAPVDILGLIARNLARASADRRRLPRIELRHLVGVRRGGEVEQFRTRDISQGGIGIEARGLAVGEAVQLTFDGLRPLDGSVRWVRGSTAGVGFTEEIGWQTLLPWLRSLQLLPGPQGSADTDGLLQDKLALRLDLAARVREGVRWWNCRIHALTPHQVEFEARQRFAPGANLWVALPEIGGGPVRVLQTRHGRTLGEFRLPLRDGDLRQLAAGRRGG